MSVTEEPPQLPGVRHEYLNVGALRMHVASAGPDDAPVLMLVHGWPQNWWVWRALIPVLAGDFRVLAPDLRGHGWSEAPPGGYDKQRLASDLLGVLDALEIERAAWIGHDWGGWAGFLAASRAPERIERMLALCIPHPWTPPKLRQLALLAYQGPVSMPVLGAKVAGPMARAILQAGRGDHRLAARDVALFADRIPARVTVAMYRTFLTRELAMSVLKRPASPLRVPTTLLVGSRDPVTHTLAPGPVSGQPQLVVEVLDGASHWLPEEQPQAILAWAHSGI